MTGIDSELMGGCICGMVCYRLRQAPMFVHCCHCTWCQRETGSACAVNALIEADQVDIIAGQPEKIDTPSSSGKGQAIYRCPACRVALWSCYGGVGELMRFIRVGTLDEPNRCPPDIHIFTSTKQHWVNLDGGAPAVEEYYQRSRYWPPESQRRYRAMLGG